MDGTSHSDESRLHCDARHLRPILESASSPNLSHLGRVIFACSVAKTLIDGSQGEGRISERADRELRSGDMLFLRSFIPMRIRELG